MIHAAAVVALPLAFGSVDVSARPMLLASALHAVTAALGTCLAVYFPARLLGRDLSDRLLYTAFTKPASKGAYFLGRLAGIWILAGLFALSAFAVGAPFLAWVDARVGPVRTSRSAARAEQLGRTQDRITLRWALPEGGGPFAARVTAINNLYWAPKVEAAWRILPKGSVHVEAFTWNAGVLLQEIPVPDALDRATGVLELELRSTSPEPFGPHFSEKSTYELVRPGRDFARLWMGDLACLWAVWLLVSALALFFSSFSSWTLAAAASLTLLFSFHSLDFLRELPALLTPRTLRSIASPTIYEHALGPSHAGCGHDHGHDHGHAGREEDPAGPVGWIRAVARRTVPLYCDLAPDLAGLDLSRRIEQGRVAGPRVWGRLFSEIRFWVAGLLILGWLRLSRLEPA